MEMGKQGVYGEVNPIEQQYSDTCAIKSQQLILQDFGIEVTEDDLVAWSAEHGLYTGNGTRMSDVGILLQEGGIPVTGKVDATVFDLVSELSQGHKVIVGVDSGELWDQGLKADLKEWWEDLRHGDTGADHALIVAGVDNSDPSNPMVLLTDPGMGDLCKRYPLDQFMDAWKDSSCFMVSTDIAPAEFASVQTANGQPAMHLADVAGNSYADFQLFHDVSQALPDMQGWDPSRGAHPISSLTQAYLDYDLIKKNPKVFCGFSDITALLNAIYAKTGLVTFSGPHFSSLGMLKGCDYTIKNMVKMLMEKGENEVAPSKEWSDDLWFIDQEKRDFIPNEGYWVLNDGQAKGTLLGGNLGTFNLLLGTSFRPKFEPDTVLFVEDTAESSIFSFMRNLTALTYQDDFKNVKGVLIGRFQKESKVSREQLAYIVKNIEPLSHLPVVANVDFGHSTPLLTLPVGGIAEINGANITLKTK